MRWYNTNFFGILFPGIHEPLPEDRILAGEISELSGIAG